MLSCINTSEAIDNRVIEMKRGIIRKILYVIISLFLLCNFLSFSNFDETIERRALSTTQTELSIGVPHGVHMEIKNEDQGSVEAINLKAKTARNISILKCYLLAISLIIAGYTFLFLKSGGFNEITCYSRLSIVNFIHKKDGRKRR